MALATLTPVASGAQDVSGTLGAGTVMVRYANEPAFSALTLAGDLALASPRVAVNIGGTLTHAASIGLNAQGYTGISLLSPVTRRGLAAELGGSVGVSAPSTGSGTGQGIAVARAHWLGVGHDVWVGAGGGAMWDATQRLDIRRVEFGVTLRGTPGSLSLGYAPTAARGAYRYQEVSGQVTRTQGPLDLRVLAGARLGAELPIAGGDRRTWAGISLTGWLSDHLAVVGGFGTYPVDLTQGYPAGRYASLALRIGARQLGDDRTASDERRTRRAAARAGIQAAAVRALDDGTVELRVRAPRATGVDVTGDPTGWVAVALEPVADGWWRVRLRTSAAVVELMLRAAGGNWVVPPGAATVTDEFGGRTGRMAVSGR